MVKIETSPLKTKSIGSDSHVPSEIISWYVPLPASKLVLPTKLEPGSLGSKGV